MQPKGQVKYYRSAVDGELHPYAVCATDTTDEPVALIIEVSPGAISDLPRAVEDTQELVSSAAKHGYPCVAVRPTGRGPGSVYQNYGEVDVLEVIEEVVGNYKIDRDRISITGASMGGAAVWYLISHYPDKFAAAAPIAGYCDYRLWEKPGGLNFHMHEWEEPSWKSRSAAFLVENLRHTPVWIVHGEWDRAIGGGVPVEHSRQMARFMAEKGFAHTYTELPKTGHDSRTPEVLDMVVPWLLEQTKAREPDHVSLTTFDLRLNRSYWSAIEQLERYGERGRVDVRLGAGRAEVTTQNVRALSLGPVTQRDPSTIVIDGVEVGQADLSRERTFRRDKDGAWTAAGAVPSSEKRHGSSGPIGDLFFEGAVLVPGAAGTAEETHFNTWVAESAARRYRATNGGVHRGGIPGENWVDLPINTDSEVLADTLVSRNLILYGNYRSNSVLAGYERTLPLRFDGDTIRLADKSYTAEKAAVFAVFPHPDNAQRYVAVHGGVTPDAIAWERFDMNLLPDFVVYSGGKLLDWGFWGNDWRSQ